MSEEGALSVRFREPKTFCEEEELVEKAVPSSTKYKNKWALSVFGEWQFARTIKVPVLDPGGLFKDYDLHKVATLSTDSPSLSSRGTQRSDASLTKVEPWTENDSLELISNPGSGKRSRKIVPTPPLEKEIQAYKPVVENGLLSFANVSFSGVKNVNALDMDGLSALHRSVLVDDVATVVFLLDNNADINLVDKDGFTPLNSAVKFERVEIAKLLLQRGANPLVENENNFTPLHLAARVGHTEMCSLLLKDSRVQVNSINQGQFSPFHLACLSGSREACELFLKSGADIALKSKSGFPPLQISAWKGHEQICQLLIETASKQLPSLGDFVNARDREGSTALQVACIGGHEGVVDLLLRHSADMEAIDLVASKSPLHVAAKHGHLTLVELLVLYGAVIDTRDGNLRTPLHRAAAFNHGQIVELLLENGADPEAKDMLAMTPLLIAAALGSSQSAKVLLDHGVDITATDSSLNSCLHLAISYRRTEMVKMLLERGRDKLLPLKDKNLSTVLHVAAGLEDSKILEILLQEKCELNKRDGNENTAIHIAATNGSLDCLEVLSRFPRFSFLLDERDENGLTALHLAAGNKHAIACDLLLSKGSDVTSVDLNGCTALHLAAKAGSLKTVKVLLSCLLPSTLERKDTSDNTPLHVACRHNRLDVLKFLLDRGADVTARNNRNMTCLDVAIEWEAAEVAKTLIRHERWEEVLKCSLSDGVWPMRKLIENLPDVAEIVLNQCITYSPLPPSHEDFSVTFNLIPLDPDVNAEFDRYFGPACMATYRREKLLNHQVTQALLRWKWMILGKFVNIFNTLVFAVFVVLFTSLMVMERERVDFSFNPFENITSAEEESSSTFARTVPYVLVIFLVAHLIKEGVQVAWLRLSYFKDLTNLLDIAMFGLVWIFILPLLSTERKDLYSMKTQWIAGVVGLLLCYINLTLSLRRFGGIGVYVTMYVEVLFTFLKVISTFLITLIGYSVVFYILLKQQGNFLDFWLALAKTSVMMVGELDYTDILVENIVNNHTVPGTDVPYVPLPALTFIVFLLFVLTVSVVLVNLLVGLAVGDIEAIQKTASLRALIDQVLLVDRIMKSYPRYILRRIHKSSLEIKPNRNSFLKRVAMAGTDLTDRDFIDMLLNQKSATNTAEEWFHFEQMRDERQEESIRKLQDTVEAQGKLLQALADRLKITD